MQPRFLRIRELATAPARGKEPARQGRYPVSAATIWRWQKQGKFPPSVRLSEQTTAWLVADLDRWDAERAGKVPAEGAP